MLGAKGFIVSEIRRSTQMPDYTGKHVTCEGSNWVQNALLGQESEKLNKCQTLLENMYPVKVHIGCKGPYWVMK